MDIQFHLNNMDNMEFCPGLNVWYIYIYTHIYTHTHTLITHTLFFELPLFQCLGGTMYTYFQNPEFTNINASIIDPIKHWDNQNLDQSEFCKQNPSEAYFLICYVDT